MLSPLCDLTPRSLGTALAVYVGSRPKTKRQPGKQGFPKPVRNDVRHYESSVPCGWPLVPRSLAAVESLESRVDYCDDVSTAPSRFELFSMFACPREARCSGW